MLAMKSKTRNKLILTVDYEIFGNATGCPQACVIQPMERMAEIAEKYGASLEIFVEALEFSAMERTVEFKDVALQVRRQLQNMSKRGHHLQLHVHPQWLGAIHEGGRWSFPGRTWRTGDLHPDEIGEMIYTADTWLKTLIDEAPCVFRAGGWCIQPSAHVLKALRELDYKADSSVAPGLRNGDAATWFDFSGCPEKAFWCISEDVTAEGDGSMLEIPIAVFRLGRFRHLLARVTRRGRARFAPECRGAYRVQNVDAGFLVNKMRRVISSSRSMLDYCSLPYNFLKIATEGCIKDGFSGSSTNPIVAIGHTKNFSLKASEDFERYLNWCEMNSYVSFSGFSEFISSQQSC